MNTFETKYMYQNKWTQLSNDLFHEDKLDKKSPYIKIIENGILLPQKDGILSWGIGGCLDKQGNLVEESTVFKAFGGAYSYDDTNIVCIDEPIIYIPIIPKHWGHFLIDAVCRLWPFIDEKYKNYTIYYDSWGFENNELTGNYKKFLEYMGIYERMKPVDKAIKVKKILIPSATMSFSESYHLKYKDIFSYVTDKIMHSDSVSSLKKKENVYFTRSQLPTSKLKEIGEKDIETILYKNGYEILSPEKLSLEEQVFYFYNAKNVASMSGTIMHNIGFAGSDTKLWIMNRTCMPNHPQLMLNKLFDNDVINVDVYAQETLKHPRDYGTGPFWIEPNENFGLFCKDMKLNNEYSIKNRRKNLMNYYLSLLGFSLKYNKLTIYLYYKLKR